MLSSWWASYNQRQAQRDLDERDAEYVERIKQAEREADRAELEKRIRDRLRLKPSALHGVGVLAAQQARLQNLATSREKVLMMKQRVEKAKDTHDLQPTLASVGVALNIDQRKMNKMLSRLDAVGAGMEAQSQIESKSEQKIAEAFVNTERPDEKAVREAVVDNDEAERVEAMRDRLDEASLKAASTVSRATAPSSSAVLSQAPARPPRGPHPPRPR